MNNLQCSECGTELFVIVDGHEKTPVGYIDLYLPEESIDGAHVESLRWHKPQESGRYAIVKEPDE